jgi:copper transport protein
MAANPAQATQTGPFSTTATSNGYLASISIVPAKVGMNEVHIYLSNPSSSLTDADAVDVSIQDPARGVDKIPLQVSKAGAGHWVNEAAWFPYAATWRLEIKARYGFDEITFTADVPTT